MRAARSVLIAAVVLCSLTSCDGTVSPQTSALFPGVAAPEADSGTVIVEIGPDLASTVAGLIEVTVTDADLHVLARRSVQVGSSGPIPGLPFGAVIVTIGGLCVLGGTVTEEGPVLPVSATLDACSVG